MIRNTKRGRIKSSVSCVFLFLDSTGFPAGLAFLRCLFFRRGEGKKRNQIVFLRVDAEGGEVSGMMIIKKAWLDVMGWMIMIPPAKRGWLQWCGVKWKWMQRADNFFLHR